MQQYSFLYTSYPFFSPRAKEMYMKFCQVLDAIYYLKRRSEKIFEWYTK